MAGCCRGARRLRCAAGTPPVRQAAADAPAPGARPPPQADEPLEEGEAAAAAAAAAAAEGAEGVAHPSLPPGHYLQVVNGQLMMMAGVPPEGSDRKRGRSSRSDGGGDDDGEGEQVRCACRPRRQCAVPRSLPCTPGHPPAR
jgi:hypothetical protein